MTRKGCTNRNLIFSQTDSFHRYKQGSEEKSYFLRSLHSTIASKVNFKYSVLLKVVNY
jgi:hypothetical protein